MARYICGICGNIFDEGKEGQEFVALEEEWCCPVCTSPKYLFEAEGGGSAVSDVADIIAEERMEQSPLAYPLEYFRPGDEKEAHMAVIHEMAVMGETQLEPMRTKMLVPGWEDVLILGAQLDPVPLDLDEDVNIRTVIGSRAKKPLVIESPVYITHMSFGALSGEAKVALARGAAAVKTAVCSGEGGIYGPEMEHAYKYIFEYVPNLYSVTDANLQNADAIEIKIGQGTKPGMGGHLPGAKVTEEVAAVRGIQPGQDVISPSKFPGINTKEDLKQLVDSLRQRSAGRPVGIKIAAGHIERDLAVIDFAGPDFITIDGRGGATGASPKVLKDAASVPTLYALRRARKYMDAHGMEAQLVITGGLRVSSDFAKALALGADAIAIGTAALMAAACQQYRMCNTGDCPMGLATMNGELRGRLNVENTVTRVQNFLRVTNEELKTYGRICGKADIHSLSMDDVCTTSSEIAAHTDIPHV